MSGLVGNPTSTSTLAQRCGFAPEQVGGAVVKQDDKTASRAFSWTV